MDPKSAGAMPHLWGATPMSEERSTVGQGDHRTSGGKAADVSPRLILLLIVATVLLYGVIYQIGRAHV